MQHQAFPSPHNRLEVFQVSLEMAAQARQVADRIPRGHRSLAEAVDLGAYDGKRIRFEANERAVDKGETVLLLPGHRKSETTLSAASILPAAEDTITMVEKPLQK